MRFSVLVVDDEPSVCESLRLTLEDTYHVRTAPSVREALSTLEAWHIDLVLLDFKMPGMNGIDFLKRIAHTWPNVPVIMITATTDVELALRMLREGAVDYLTKPFDVERILQMVRTVWQRQGRLQQMEWQQLLRWHQQAAVAMNGLDAWFKDQTASLVSDSILVLCGGSAEQRRWLTVQYYLRSDPNENNFYQEQGPEHASRAGLLERGLWYLDAHHLPVGEIPKRVMQWQAVASLPLTVVVGVDHLADAWLARWQVGRPLQVWQLPVVARSQQRSNVSVGSWNQAELKLKLMGSH